MAELIKDFFSTPIPAKVWHYTSIEALEGILSSQKIFATEARHTTDPQEFVHARQVASDYLNRHPVPDMATRRSKESAQSLLEMAFGQDGLLAPDQSQVFIASFSGSEDKRSQWADYSNEATGVSIAFDLRGIRPPYNLDSGITFAPCIYLDSQKEVLLEEALGGWARAIEQLFLQSENKQELSHWINNQRAWDRYFGVSSSRAELLRRKEAEFRELIRPAALKASFDLLRIASHCKQGKFLDENEWRLALPHTVGKPFNHNKIEFRGENIPYIAHSLFHFRLPITEIMLGANCAAEARVKILLTSRNLQIPITFSRLKW